MAPTTKKKAAARPHAKKTPKPPRLGPDAGLDLARLRSEIEARGYSPSEFWRQCVLVGYSGASRTIGMIVEGNVANPSLRAVWAMAAALGLRVDDLIIPGDPARAPLRKPPKP
jgi:hypothetical protein